MSRPRSARLTSLVMVLLLIEFLDELVFGAREAAWPLVRDDLGLNYLQIGLLLGLPGIASSVIEPFLGILGDVWRRRALILGGGILFALALALMAVSNRFGLLLSSFILFYPASGAFVSLSQATLMDTDPGRHEHNMARWTLAGSLGIVTGPLVLGAVAAVGLGWRELYGGFAVAALLVLAVAWRLPIANKSREGQPSGETPGGFTPAFMTGARRAFNALKNRSVLRWLVLLQFSNLMLDVLLGFLALYLVDVAGVSPAEAGIGVAVWTGAGLAGDLLLIPLLERARGLRYLRFSAMVELAMMVAFLLVPVAWARYLLLALLGLFNAGWYSILKAQLYSAMPGQSGTVMTVDNLAGLVGGLLPLGLGLVGQRFGLGATMWLLLLGPIALLAGIPRADPA